MVVMELNNAGCIRCQERDGPLSPLGVNVLQVVHTKTRDVATNQHPWSETRASLCDAILVQDLEGTHENRGSDRPVWADITVAWDFFAINKVMTLLQLLTAAFSGCRNGH